jgi:putative toxin-antitoxin system antitoxin component (TIGR02293 family)
MSAAYALARPVVMPSELLELQKRGFSNDEIYRIVGPRRTLARRMQKNERLSVAETDRVLRIKRISELVERAFGNHEKAFEWMREPCRALGDSIPIELLETEQGGRVVEEELMRIRYGIYV